MNKKNISDHPKRDDIQPLLKITDLEQMLRVNKRTIARLTKSGVLPMPLKLGSSNRWRLNDVIGALDCLDGDANPAPVLSGI